MSLKSLGWSRRLGIAAAVGTLLATALIAGCGGGGGAGGTTSQASSAAVSSGAITAFGSVFVNGHEFGTSRASVIDDDTGETSSASKLEVGMVVSVKPMSDSTDRSPEAAEIHVSPLARGFVDASTTSPSTTLTVMGQTVQLTSATVFSDRRACVTAATPCTAITGQSGLTATAGATPGSFVAVHGYLFSPGASGSAQIVATLVSVQDYTATGTKPSRFKLEGQVTAVSAAASAPSVTVGAETVDLSKAVCRSGGSSVDCATAFKQGDVVAAHGATAPAGSTFTADAARLVKLLPQTAGATVEIEGKVSSVNGTNFVVRGIQIDGSALTTLPAVGDKIELVGTVSDDGTTVKATSIEHDEHAAAARVVLAGPLSAVADGATAGTFTVTVLGQTATVDASTHIADRTTDGPTTFNITNFKTYLDGKTVFVIVRTVADSTGALRATGFDIVKAPAGGFVAVAGTADAAPVVSGTTATVTVHGVSVVYDPAKATVVQGNIVVALGTLNSGGAIDTTVSKGRLVVRQASGRDGGGDDCDVDFEAEGSGHH